MTLIPFDWVSADGQNRYWLYVDTNADTLAESNASTVAARALRAKRKNRCSIAYAAQVHETSNMPPFERSEIPVLQCDTSPRQNSTPISHPES